MSKILTVVCDEKGAGKTTTVAAIASSLATLGHKTLCISYKTDAKMLERALCIDVPKDTLYLDDTYELGDIIDRSCQHVEIPNLFYISVQTRCAPEELDASRVLLLFAIIRHKFDFCVIDTRPEICAATKLAITDADTLLVVATEEISSLYAAREVVDSVHEMGIGDVQILVNKVNPTNFVAHWENVDKLLETIDARLVGVILEDDNIREAAVEQTPLIMHRRKLAIYDFMDTARRLIGEIVPWPFHKRQPVITTISVKGVSNKLVGPYGDPGSWAQSTLDDDVEHLAKIFEIKPDKNTPLEVIRNRIWLHDLLDVERIPYKVVVSGFWASRNKYSLSQSIYVEQKNRNKARVLVLEHRKSNRTIYTTGKE